ncbi:hypothetical protein NPX13_g6699 [Xylaria arbuscula]|uniref:Rhodopsin domain-containing protein n=1 Tax=Xylaria arbuscula TaxID=114810 RepID=A0A9W8NBQ5_9PEZI|nr:hypothetical protein NPX13_g6699 [Xylaria arbuscula]
MADLDDIPSGKPVTAPPPGVAPNYDEPRSMGPDFVLLGIFLSLSLAAVLTRIFVRFRFTKNWGWDDYTCVIAAAGSLAYAIHYGQAMKAHPGKHMSDVNASSNPIAIAGQAFTRITIATIVILTLTYIPLASLSAAFKATCDNLTSFIDNPFCSGYSIPALLFSAIFNVVTDVWLLLLPFPLLINLKLRPRQKLGLALVFAAGVGACSASIARLAKIIIDRGSANSSWSQGIISQFSIAEINIGIIVASASTFPVFFNAAKDWLSVVTRTRSKHTRLPG